MLAILAAALLAATPHNDTVFMADGGRVVGTVIEEGPHGVSIQALDGTVRRYARRDVVRIEYADGTVTTTTSPAAPAPQQLAAPVAPPSAPAQVAAPAVPPAAPVAPSSAPPAAPVVQQYTPPAQPPAVPAPQPYAPPPPPQYAPPPQAPPPPPYTPPPPPRYTPYPPYPPPYAPRYPTPAYRPVEEQRRGLAPISAFYAALGVGGLSMSGEIEQGVSMNRVFQPQVALWLETGVRLAPEVALGLYLDVGVGEPASEIRAECSTLGTTCTMSSGRVGVLLRHTFVPYARTAPWIAVGTAYEFGGATADQTMMGGSSSSELFTYHGWEALRLMAGVDIRSNPVLGVGLYGAVAFGKYTKYEDAAGTVTLDRQPFHTTVEGGLRFTLFP